MARFSFILFAGILFFAVVYASEVDESTKRCRGANEIYDCRPEYQWEKCADRLRSPPFNPGNTKCRCYCRTGYWRDDNYVCVKPEQCPKKCKGPHEKYIDCPAGQCNPKTCDDLVNPPGCPKIKPPCPGGCVCEDGYLRNSTGICIKKEQCPSMQCKKPHERYSICLLGECVPKTCDDVGYPVPCPDIIGPCAGGCTCEQGFVRDCNGDCIEMKKCPCCGGDPNAVSGCGNPCGKTCASIYANKSDLVCPEYCQYNGCDCKPGFLLLKSNNTDSSKCVPKSECPKPTPQCGKNEQYYCGTSCPEATCANPTPPTCVNKKCKLGCFCKKGFVRDTNNRCIPVGKCPQKCKGPHEKYIACPAGECIARTCKNLIVPFPCPLIIPPCPGGCVCEDGYLRDSKGICIKKELCPLKCTGPHEKYIDCPAGECIPRTCKNLIVPFPCPLIIPPCPGGCVCEDGYLRDAKGICIKKEQCPSVCKDPNASWTECMDACPKTCQNPNPGCVNKKCSAGCQCNPGYVLSKIGGKCVKIEDCTAPKCKGPHEKYIDCPARECIARTCKNLIVPFPCPLVIPPCPGGCVCEDGYLRDAKGICIKKELCPSVCKDPNASWTECMDACPRTCQNTNPGCVNIRCSAGCQCNTGYVLSKIGGKCVKIEECKDYANCCGCANQTYVDCTFKCPQVMCPESDQILLCKPPKDCPGGCGCKPYYRYNATGDCIKASDCPPIECTGANQVWTSCQRISDWERCEDRFNSPPINPGDPDDCTPKCVCKKGYWRNNANECVTENECPP